MSAVKLLLIASAASLTPMQNLAPAQFVSPSFIGGKRVAIQVPPGWRIEDHTWIHEWDSPQSAIMLVKRGGAKRESYHLSFFNWSGGRAIRNGVWQGRRYRSHSGLSGILSLHLFQHGLYAYWYAVRVADDDVLCLRVLVPGTKGNNRRIPLYVFRSLKLLSGHSLHKTSTNARTKTVRHR